jgi:hypothetical protein
LYVSRNETCTEKDDQPSEGEKECRLPPEAVIGLTAGAIAGIVIGVAVAVGLATCKLPLLTVIFESNGPL